MLDRNLVLDQSIAWQLTKIADKRIGHLLLDIDVDRVSNLHQRRIITDPLPGRHVDRLAVFIEMNAGATFEHSKFNDTALVNMPQHSRAGDRRGHRTNLALPAAGLFG